MPSIGMDGFKAFRQAAQSTFPDQDFLIIQPEEDDTSTLVSTPGVDGVNEEVVLVADDADQGGQPNSASVGEETVAQDIQCDPATVSFKFFFFEFPLSFSLIFSFFGS
ncbi:hypothetical protein U1Q18_052509 [Sarracenia purpurea var. burkii]